MELWCTEGKQGISADPVSARSSAGLAGPSLGHFLGRSLHATVFFPVRPHATLPAASGGGVASASNHARGARGHWEIVFARDMAPYTGYIEGYVRAGDDYSGCQLPPSSPRAWWVLSPLHANLWLPC